MPQPSRPDQSDRTIRTPVEWERLSSEELVAAYRLASGAFARDSRMAIMCILFERVRPIVWKRVRCEFFEDVLQSVRIRLWLELSKEAEANEATSGPHVDFANSVGFDAVDAVRPHVEANRGLQSTPSAAFDRRLAPPALSAEEIVGRILDVAFGMIEDPIERAIFDALRHGLTMKEMVERIGLGEKRIRKKKAVLFKRLRQHAVLRKLFAKFGEHVDPRWASLGEVRPADRTGADDVANEDADPSHGAAGETEGGEAKGGEAEGGEGGEGEGEDRH